MTDINIHHKINELQKLINRHQKITLISHVNPDGDAIGSSLAMYLFLKQMGKTVTVMTPNDYPGFLKWLPGSKDLKIYERLGKRSFSYVEQADLLICLDFNAQNRLDALATPFNASNAPKVLIDHHPMPENFTDILISSTDVSSTAELLYHVLERIAPDFISKEVAEALFTGILTDTGSFSYNASNPGTYDVVGKLLQKGINKDEINAKIFDNYSIERMRLMGYCLHERMEVFPDYHAAFIPLSRKDMEKFNFRTGDSEGFVNLPLSIKGVIFTALFTERKTFTKASFRSKGAFDVNSFARDNFSGGGHLNAAGGYMEASLEETLEAFRLLLPKYQQQLKMA